VRVQQRVHQSTSRAGADVGGGTIWRSWCYWWVVLLVLCAVPFESLRDDLEGAVFGGLEGGGSQPCARSHCSLTRGSITCRGGEESTIQYSTVQNITAQSSDHCALTRGPITCMAEEEKREYSTVQYSTVQYSTVLYSTVQGPPLACRGSWEVQELWLNRRRVGSGAYLSPRCDLGTLCGCFWSLIPRPWAVRSSHTFRRASNRSRPLHTKQYIAEEDITQ